MDEVKRSQSQECKMGQPITVSEEMLGSLNATQPWVKFLAIVCFVVAAFVFLGGVITVAGFSLGHETSPLRAVFGPIAGVPEILASVFFYLIPGVFLLRYGNAILGVPAAGHGKRLAAAENPVEVREDILHRAAGVLRAVHSRPDYFRDYLWLDIASVMYRYVSVVKE
jgi:hypothetical protein